MKTVLVDQKDKQTVIDALNKDGVVAFPTETVFGLAVKYNSIAGLNKLFAVKQRDLSKAITLMINNSSDIGEFAVIDKKSQKLIDKYMPGMITLIFKKQGDVKLFPEIDTIGIRIPDSTYVLDLLSKTGPLLVTSANISGQQALLNSEDVLKEFDQKIDVVVAGESNSTVASSVVDVSESNFKVIREGLITKQEIEEAINEVSDS